jgi:SAM-dependent methyltransferase
MSDEFSQLQAAYEGLENPESFRDADAQADYRDAMLERSRPQADRIDVLNGRGRVLEVACGNGRLLVELAQRGLAQSGLGIDIAHSRIEFAKRWAEDAGHGSLDFRADDIFAVEIPAASFDVAVCITGAFAYFEPVRAGAARQLLETMRAALVPNGLLVMELYQHPREVGLVRAAGGDLCMWKELPEPDPWRYYLSRYELSGDSVLTHEKTFVHRLSGEIDEGRSERLRIYEPQEVAELLQQTGFADVEMFEGWISEAYDGGDVLVVTARAA